jgi:hypothetical protein
MDVGAVGIPASTHPHRSNVGNFTMAGSCGEAVAKG